MQRIMGQHGGDLLQNNLFYCKQDNSQIYSASTVSNVYEMCNYVRSGKRKGFGNVAIFFFYRCSFEVKHHISNMFTYSMLLVDVWGFVLSSVKGNAELPESFISPHCSFCISQTHSKHTHTHTHTHTPFPIQDKYETKRRNSCLKQGN